MDSNQIASSLQAAITNYFAGERHEGVLIIAGSVLAASLGVWLWAATRSSFAVAFGATVLLAGAPLTVTAGALMVRDKPLAESMLRGIDSGDRSLVVTAERARVEVIISKYRYYQYAAAILAAMSVIGLLISDRPWVHGTVAGLLLLVAAQVVIDHYSAQRARSYHERLSSSFPPPQD